MKNVLPAFVAALLLGSLAGPAHATRTIAGYDYPDLCKNRGEYAMRGTQTIQSVAGGWIAFVDPTQKPNRAGKRDCERVWRKR